MTSIMIFILPYSHFNQQGNCTNALSDAEIEDIISSKTQSTTYFMSDPCEWSQEDGCLEQLQQLNSPFYFPLGPVSVLLTYIQILSPRSNFLRNYKSKEVQVLSLISLDLVQTNSLFLSTLMAVTHSLTLIFFPSNIISIEAVPVSISLFFFSGSHVKHHFSLACLSTLLLQISGVL